MAENQRGRGDTRALMIAPDLLGRTQSGSGRNEQAKAVLQ